MKTKQTINEAYKELNKLKIKKMEEYTRYRERSTNEIK